MSSECVDSGSVRAELLSHLTPADKEELTKWGWPGFHISDINTCVSGCSHCMVCDPFCSADWGLYF